MSQAGGFDLNALLGLFGGGLGALGGFLGAQGSNRAIRRAGDERDARGAESMARVYNTLYGGRFTVPPGTASVRQATDPSQLPPDIAPRGAGGRGLVGFNQQTTRQGLGQYNRAVQGFENDAARLGGMTSGNYLFADRAGANIDRLGADAENIARGYGRGANALIDQETQRALQGANAISQARMNATGLGNSTLVSNALSGNAVQAGLGASRQKLDVQRDMTDRLLGARQTRLFNQQQNATRSLGARRDALDTERSLSAARTGLGTGRAGLLMDQRNRNANFEWNALSGATANPLVGTLNIPAGYSSAGSALGSLGTVLGGLAGSGLFSGNRAAGNGQMSPEMMAWLQNTLFAGT